MGCFSIVWAGRKLRKGHTNETKQEDELRQESSSDEPKPHQFLTKRTGRTFSSGLGQGQLARKISRDSDKSLSTLAYSESRKNTRKRISSKITTWRRNCEKHRQNSNKMKKSEGMAGLRNTIKTNMILQGAKEQRFMPRTAINDVFKRENVTEALKKLEGSLKVDIPTLVSFICEKATRIFAILVWSDAQSLIEQFYEHCLGDESLPIHCDTENEDRLEVYSCKNGDKIPIGNHPFNHEVWTERNLEHFCNDDQWPFLSPIFSEEQFRYNFDDSTHLPFVDQRFRSQKESFFSIVQEWRIHRDHLQTRNHVDPRTGPNDHPRVAIKELKQTSLSNEDFEAIARTEVNALEMIRDLNHPHLIKAIAYYKKGNKHCVMFPWAERGNLRDFWKRPPPKLSRRYLRWVFTQFCGLAEAIERLHHSHKDKVMRHGDLKPENILCFDGEGGSNHDQDECMLVIADVGLSKSHDKLTELRKDATRTNSGTIMYEPPETELQRQEPRSRRYDVWSLGCIYLEFIVWLLYGATELDRFKKELTGSGSNARFYVIEEDAETRKRTPRPNKAVEKWVDWIRKDRRCPEKTAIRNLVELVVARLLIPDVSSVSKTISGNMPTISAKESSPFEHPTPSFNIQPPTTTGDIEPKLGSTTTLRATAHEVFVEIKGILEEATNKSFEWMIWDSPPQQGPQIYGAFLEPFDKRIAKDQENEYRFTPLDDNWKYTPDIDTANHIFSDVDLRASIEPSIETPQLCQRCQDLQLWLPRYTFTDTFTEIIKRSSYCDLCRLLWKRTHAFSTAYSDRIQFFRVGSSLTLNDRQSQPIVSIYAIPSHDTLTLDYPISDFQPGYPKLSDPGSLVHVRILNEWIRSCDEDHLCCPKEQPFLPTRVLDVGGSDSTTVRLFCGTRRQTSPGRYVALSHRWGSPSLHRKFCTTKDNLESHRLGIRVADLPQTFKDAVAVTRALSIRYLWIDSICIIQNDDQDWEKESRLMEQVFSCAYVTIAASCASGTEDGFLKPRPTRDCVPMKKGNGSQFYLCDAIDDFSQDVDQGELNKRGWVLQERALSRRTIHFAENQTYWECGEGIRCETLMKMRNKKASFLGDANFPTSVEAYVKGMKIELFQSLYERYSNLSLSFDQDRPIAIKGLEKRLIQTLKTSGGYGIFDCYLYRCLLWQSSGDTLKRIKSSHKEKIPSWSWMAYTGGIEYMNVPFGKVLWSKNIHSPFKKPKKGGIYDDEKRWKPLGIRARAWRLVDGRINGLILDDVTRRIDRPMRCVILGTDKEGSPLKPQKHYVLVVSTVSNQETDMYERIGVGILVEAQIVRDEPATTIRII